MSAAAEPVDVLALVRDQADYHPEMMASGEEWEAAVVALAELIRTNNALQDAIEKHWDALPSDVWTAATAAAGALIQVGGAA